MIYTEGKRGRIGKASYLNESGLKRDEKQRANQSYDKNNNCSLAGKCVNILTENYMLVGSLFTKENNKTLTVVTSKS